MNNFNRSTTSAHSNVNTAGNQLVIVVIKAQDLPNRRKLDKQSPYVVARIQDQTQRTRVVHRGGQTPKFNQELWFSLDNIESTTVNLMIYHQQKKDSELVCQADIDFSIALRKSINEGYDSWFSLQYKDRPAGKIYLEMTYYPSADSVPVAVSNIPRDGLKSLSKSVPAMAAQARMSQSTRSRAAIMPGHDEPLPALPDLDDLEDDVSELNIPMGSANKNESWMQNKGNKETVEQKQDSDKGWLSKLLENASNINKTLPYIFSSPPKAKVEEKKNNKMSFQRQLSSPSLVVDDIPRKLFVDSSDEEDEEITDHDAHSSDLTGRTNVEFNDEWSQNRRSPRPGLLKNSKNKNTKFQVTKISSQGDTGSDEFEVGQKVEFRTSKRFAPKGTENLEQLAEEKYIDSEFPMEHLDRERRISSLRQSFKIKPLPAIKSTENEIPPPPPKHLIPTDLEDLFSKSEIRDEDGAKKAPLIQPRKVSNRSPPSLLDSFSRNRTSPNSCKRKTLSYSEIRRLRFLGMMND